MYIKLDVDVDNRVNAYAARGMAYKMLGTYINTLDRAHNLKLAAEDFSLAIELLQKNQISGPADKNLQMKIADLCIQRAFTASDQNAMGISIVRDCIKYLANHPWGLYSDAARHVLIKNLEYLYHYDDYQHRSRHDHNKNAFLKALQDPKLSIEEQEQILKLLIDSSTLDSKGKDKSRFDYPVGTFFLKHTDTLDKIIDMFNKLQIRKKMDAQDIYAISPPNPALLYTPKQTKEFDIDAEYDKYFGL